MRIAVLSDIHGNRWALEEVLKSIEDRGIKKIVNLGDCLYGPLDPAGTADILMDLSLPTVRGNEDRILLETKSSARNNPSFSFVKKYLKQRHLKWLKTLPPFTALDCMFFLCHGTPDRDDDYLLEGVGEKGAFLRSEKEIAPMVEKIKLPVILCGHSHVPGRIQIVDGPLIVNPGSVGLPAYSDSHPYPHKMETKTPHARYAVVEKRNSRWRVEDISVVYDWDSASNAAEMNGRPDWAFGLKTGRTKQIRVQPRNSAAPDMESSLL